MPHKASELDAASWLRLYVMGNAKVGKSCSIICTAPGPVYVINCDQKNSLEPVRARCRMLGLPEDHFEWDFVRDVSSMAKAMQAAFAGVKEGRYKTIVLDTISKYAQRLLLEMLHKSKGMGGKGEDGRRAYPETAKRVHAMFDRMDAWPAHVIWLSHFEEDNGMLIDGQLEKSGHGIAPLLPGKLRKSLPADFQDVVYLDKAVVLNKKTGKKVERRVLHTSINGVWGPGCRSLAKNDPSYRVVPADIKKLIQLFEEQKSLGRSSESPAARKKAG